MDRETRERLEARIAELLMGGQVVTAAVMAELGIDAPAVEACEQWQATRVRQAVHRVAKRMEWPVMALGTGLGHKLIQTVDEARRAFAYTVSRLKGERRRMARLKDRLLKLHEMGQRTFDIDALMADLALVEEVAARGAEVAPQPAQTASA